MRMQPTKLRSDMWCRWHYVLFAVSRRLLERAQHGQLEGLFGLWMHFGTEQNRRPWLRRNQHHVHEFELQEFVLFLRIVQPCHVFHISINDASIVCHIEVSLNTSCSGALNMKWIFSLLSIVFQMCSRKPAFICIGHSMDFSSVAWHNPCANDLRYTYRWHMHSLARIMQRCRCMSGLRQSFTKSIHAIAGAHCQNLFNRFLFWRLLELRSAKAAAEQRWKCGSIGQSKWFNRLHQ